MEEKIIEKSEWISMKDIPSYSYSNQTNKMKNFWSKYNGSNGVYQIIKTKDIKKIDNKIVHKDIGYSGKSSFMPRRVYESKTPSATHGVARGIVNGDLNLDELSVRLLFTNPGDENELEKIIQTKTSEKYGYRYKWKFASLGNDGNVSKIINTISKLSIEELTEDVSQSNSLIKDLLIDEYVKVNNI